MLDNLPGQDLGHQCSAYRMLPEFSRLRLISGCVLEEARNAGCHDGPEDILSTEIHDRVVDIVYLMSEPKVGRIAHSQNISRYGLIESNNFNEL